MAEQIVPTPERFERDSDKRLFLAIRGRLWDYEPLRVTHPQLELDVRHGTVRLGGRVRTLAQKQIAEYICRREPGVGVVRNEILSDTELGRQVADTLAADPLLAPLCLRVDSRDGVVTLSGELPSPELEITAIEAARGAPGPLDVVSEVVVRPAVRPPTAPPPQVQASPESEVKIAEATTVEGAIA